MEVKVVIVGAGPAGLSTSACLNRFSIPNVVLEREDCCASLWKKRSYDRLKLHLHKQFCELPHMPFPKDSPKFMPRNDFIHYLDEYALRFGIRAHYRRNVESARFDMGSRKWLISARNVNSGSYEDYVADFLVVASGENSEGIVPNVKGLDTFQGLFMHSSSYDSGEKYRNKDVLVVGCGNSGMEIAYDLSNHCAKTSIVARNPVSMCV